MTDSDDPKKIIVDEDWKAQVRAEKETLEKQADSADETPAAEPSSSGTMPQQLPPPTFSELVTIFATQASASLQESVDPNNQDAATHRIYAKHFIDLLAVLEEKTKGNLDAEEAKMVDTALHELRMAYVNMKK